MNWEDNYTELMLESGYRQYKDKAPSLVVEDYSGGQQSGKHAWSLLTVL